MNGHCDTCDVEKECAYGYKPCDCRDYLKFKPKSPELNKPSAQILPFLGKTLKENINKKDTL